MSVISTSTLFAVFSLVFVFQNTAAQTTRTEKRSLNLAETIRFAVENAPSLKQTSADAEIRGYEEKNAFSVFLPQLDLSATQGWQGEFSPSNESRPVRDLSLLLTETFYDNGVSLTRYEAAQLRRRVADLELKRQRDQLALDVALEFMRYSQAVRLAAVQEQQLKSINKQFASISSQYRQGIKTRRDFIRFKSELRRSEIESQTSAAAIEKSKVELLRLMGAEQARANGAAESAGSTGSTKSVAAFEVVAFEFNALDVDLKEPLSPPQHAPDLANHPDFRIAELQRQVFAIDVALVRREYWPQISVTAGATYHTGDGLGVVGGGVSALADTTSWSALLGLKWNLLDWGLRRNNISIAELQRSKQEFALEQRLDSLEAESAQLMIDLRESTQRFELAKELLQLEADSYGLLETDYRNGRVSYLDLILALRGLLSARQQVTTSYFDLRSQLARHLFFEGKLYETFSK